MARRQRIARTAAMVLVGPVLIVLGGILYERDAPRILVGVLQMAGWVGGPVLIAWAVVLLVREERRTHPEMRSRRVGLPSTRSGWISAALLGGLAAFMLIFFAAIVLGGQRGGDTFFSNLYLTVPFLLAAACGVLAGAVAVYAVAFRHERSIATLMVLAAGMLVLVFGLGEIGGHEEPGSGRRSGATATPGVRSAPNSHDNATAVPVSATEVRVSFDYSYNQDPTGRPITAITVTALGPDGRQIAGHTPVVTPITRGSGHLDVSVAFSPGQLASVTGFTVCFTAPGNPDLGCARIAYPPR